MHVLGLEVGNADWRIEWVSSSKHACTSLELARQILHLKEHLLILLDTKWASYYRGSLSPQVLSCLSPLASLKWPILQMKFSFNPACPKNRIPTSPSPQNLRVKFGEMKQLVPDIHRVNATHDILCNCSCCPFLMTAMSRPLRHPFQNMKTHNGLKSSTWCWQGGQPNTLRWHCLPAVSCHAETMSDCCLKGFQEPWKSIAK